MMAVKQINYAALFGSYVMKTQRELAIRNEREKMTGSTENNAILQETVEDYIEQA